jgi:biopolymer transport protein ExbD
MKRAGKPHDVLGMNFRSRGPDRPELNLIPMIDVLIVLLIFLVLTTTFRREAGLSIRLPQATAAGAPGAAGIEVAIDAGGHLQINRTPVADAGVESLKGLLRSASKTQGDRILIRADRMTPHQVVMTVLDAASQVGLAHVSFAVASAPVLQEGQPSMDDVPP